MENWQASSSKGGIDVSSIAKRATQDQIRIAITPKVVFCCSVDKFLINILQRNVVK